ncbi:MAG: hypothetical protein ACRDZO_05215 [Egibacteraceae bacterium]
MSERERRWSVAAVDARLADPDRDLDLLAADLGLPAEPVRCFAKVREVLLAGRAASPGLSLSDLAAARVDACDVIAYLQVSDRVLELARDERWRLSQPSQIGDRPRGGRSL